MTRLKSFSQRLKEITHPALYTRAQRDSWMNAHVRYFTDCDQRTGRVFIAMSRDVDRVRTPKAGYPYAVPPEWTRETDPFTLEASRRINRVARGLEPAWWDDRATLTAAV